MTLAELERSAHVPVEEQVVEQETTPPHDAMAPEDLDRARLLGVTGAGRLKVR